MNDTFKIMVFGTLGTFVSAIPHSGDFCAPRELCALKAEEMWHVQEREPAPTQTVGYLATDVSTAATGGTFYVVIPK
jgi:hypothetical protein